MKQTHYKVTSLLQVSYTFYCQNIDNMGDNADFFLFTCSPNKLSTQIDRSGQRCACWG